VTFVFYDIFMLIWRITLISSPNEANCITLCGEKPLYQFRSKDCPGFYDYYATSKFNYAKLLNEL